MCELPHGLLNKLRLRISGKKEILAKSQSPMGTKPSAYPSINSPTPDVVGGIKRLHSMSFIACCYALLQGLENFFLTQLSLKTKNALPGVWGRIG